VDGLLLPLAIPVLVVFLGALIAGFRERPLSWAEVLGAWLVTLVGEVVTVVVPGQSTSWVVVVGTIAALAIAVSPVLLVSLGVANKLVRNQEASWVIVIATVLCSITLVWLAPALTVSLICTFTNDCL
jgi:hypothetical protein